MDLRDTDCEDVRWRELAQVRVQGGLWYYLCRAFGFCCQCINYITEVQSEGARSVLQFSLSVDPGEFIFLHITLTRKAQTVPINHYKTLLPDSGRHSRGYYVDATQKRRGLPRHFVSTPMGMGYSNVITLMTSRIKKWKLDISKCTTFANE
jgi:hypothetical protein